jgi:hypothetical protein
MTSTFTPVGENSTKLEVEVIVVEEDPSVYIRLTGFDNLEDADKYASHLTEHLPLMLFESEIMH